MAAEDRIGPAAYTAPSGDQVVFEFEDVQKTIRKKTNVIEFVGANVSYVQESGTAGRSYPLTVYFSGPNYDVEADRFENLLVEDGVGVLDHPKYGRKNVKPVGEITREDPLVSAANQAVITVTFQESIEDVYPSALEDTSAKIEVAVATLGDLVAGDLALADLADAGENASFLAKAKALANGIQQGLATASGALSNAQNKLDSISSGINSAINLGIATPLLLLRQLQNLILTPGRIAGQVQARLDGYLNLAQDIFSGIGSTAGGGISSLSRSGSDPGVVPADGSAEAANTFRLNRALAALAVGGIAVTLVTATKSATGSAANSDEGKASGAGGGSTSSSSPSSSGSAGGTSSASSSGSGRGGASRGVVGTGESVETQEEAARHIAALTKLADELQAWTDDNHAALVVGAAQAGAEVPLTAAIDTGEVSSGVAAVVATVKAHMARVVVSLGSARVHVTAKDTTLLELGGLLYGDPMGARDKLIIDNGFAAHEILMVPRGFRVRYYV